MEIDLVLSLATVVHSTDAKSSIILVFDFCCSAKGREIVAPGSKLSNANGPSAQPSQCGGSSCGVASRITKALRCAAVASSCEPQKPRKDPFSPLGLHLRATVLGLPHSHILIPKVFQDFLSLERSVSPKKGSIRLLPRNGC